VPWINWALLVSVLTLVFTFESSTKLAYAYGTAVTATISITAILFFYLVRRKWRRPLWVVIGGAAAILTVDLTFFAANLTKVLHGAWLPLLIGLAVYLVMSTWQTGSRIITAKREAEEGTLRKFVDEIDAMVPPLTRVPGTAVFLNRAQHTAPLAMRANVKHNEMLHAHVLILSLETVPVPYVADADRLTVDDLGHRDDGIVLVNARFGFKETPDVPHVVRLAAAAGLEMPVEPEEATYFLSKIDIRPVHRHGMATWRKRLFHATSRITSDASEYFGLPHDRTVIMGSRIDL
jgi:KUP system potassium uptake protein